MTGMTVQRNSAKADRPLNRSLFFAVCIVLAACSLLPAFPSTAAGGTAEILLQHIRDNYPWPEIELGEITLSGTVPDEQPRRVLVKNNLPGKSVFLLEFANDVKITAVAEVKAFDRVVMSSRAFRKGYCLQKDDVYVTLADVTRIPKDAFKSPDKVIGKILTRSVIPNMPFADNMVSESQQVKRGRKVSLLAGSEGFNISAMGEMKESAYVGSYVKVINLSSRKAVTGILIDENTVNVDF